MLFSSLYTTVTLFVFSIILNTSCWSFLFTLSIVFVKGYVAEYIKGVNEVLTEIKGKKILTMSG